MAKPVALLTPDPRDGGSGIHAQVFNHQLRIPVIWKRAEKVRYRGGRGMYDYANSQSAGHVLLLDELKFGRIKRQRGDFLCGSKITDRKLHDLLNMNDMATTEEHIKNSKRQKVTCKRCLELAHRFQRSDHYE